MFAACIAALLLCELLLLPWTAHAFDAVSFMLHSDRVFFMHVSPVRWWAFGSISLFAILVSQLPVLFFPSLWQAMPVRLFLLKLPYWFADVGTAAIVRTCAPQTAANAWALRYLLDPAVIFVTVFHGQQDALPNFFAVAGIALMLSERYELSAVALGLGAGTKFYPAAFVPLLLVVAGKRASWRVSGTSALCFAGTAALTLAPVFWGRLHSVAGEYTTYSFGNEGNRVVSASLWSLLPAGTLPQPFEQGIAMAIPIVLALARLRAAPERRGIARTAMFSAMSIVLLNPGAHQPFFVWIAGPLVLYAAVAENGLVSLGGVLLSISSILIQFSQEGSDEYFLLNFGPGWSSPLLRRVAPVSALEWCVAACALAIVLAATDRSWQAWARERVTAAAVGVALAFCVLFFAAIGCEMSLARFSGAKPTTPYWNAEQSPNVIALSPHRTPEPGGCALTYGFGDVVVVADNPYAARYARAFLAYTLASPETLTIRGREVSLDALPKRYDVVDVIPVDRGPIRTTESFEITPYMNPVATRETIVERPCGLIAGTPVLYYRLDLARAIKDAMK